MKNTRRKKTKYKDFLSFWCQAQVLVPVILTRQCVVSRGLCFPLCKMGLLGDKGTRGLAPSWHGVGKREFWVGVGSAGALASASCSSSLPFYLEIWSFLCTFQPRSHMTLAPRGEGSQRRCCPLVKGQASPQRSSDWPKDTRVES